MYNLPQEVLKRYEKWKDIVSISGPNGLRAIRGFNDEALHGQWKGFRSSRLGLKQRLIYKIEATAVLVKVIDLTPHDYRKK
jgi:toxin HigB-1